MNSQPSSSSTRATVLVGGGAPATMIRTRSRPGISPSQDCGRLQHGRDDRGRRAHHGDAVPLDPAQDLGAVDLADDDLLDAQPGHRERHAPAVGVEHRQRVQVDVAVGDARVEPERHRVDPDVAMGDLHALGPGRRAGRVVDAGGGGLVGFPGLRFGTLGGEQVVVVAEDEPVLGGDLPQRVVELGVDQQDPRTGVLDDVADLVGTQPEVHRHEHPPRAGHPEERGEQPGTVVAHDGDPVPHPDPELVELRGLAAGERADLGVRQLPTPQRRCRLVGFVDDPGPVAVHLHGPVDEVGNAERNDHRVSLERLALTPPL